MDQSIALLFKADEMMVMTQKSLFLTHYDETSENIGMSLLVLIAR